MNVPDADVHDLSRRIQSGDKAAVARGITMVERRHAGAAGLLQTLRPSVGRAHRIGVTGPPGAGKSTLISTLVKPMVRTGSSIGVVAVDPSSPYSGGAVLGDRVRMAELDTHDGVFIRSMATRGDAGGLSAATADVADILDAAGYELVLIESAGIGQVELNIGDLADTTIVVLVPEAGDQVQAIKAGVMEIADIYVVNKADRPGAANMLAAIQSSLRHRNLRDSDWPPLVLQTSATQETGYEALVEAIRRHGQHLQQQGRLAARRRRGMAARILHRAKGRVREGLEGCMQDPGIGHMVQAALDGDKTPQQCAEELVDLLLKTDRR